MQLESLPFARLMGVTVISVTPDLVIGELKVREDLCTFGRVHRSSRTFNSPITRSGVTLITVTPISLAKGRDSSCIGLPHVWCASLAAPGTRSMTHEIKSERIGVLIAV